MKNSDTNKELKSLVGKAAAGLIQDGMVCGIGTGSTVAFLIDELGRRVREESLKITGVPTSFQSRLLCREQGIPTLELQDCSGLDLAIDGADEVDRDFNAIKGGGAAHTREKLVAAMAQQFVLIVDETKLVPKLGTGFAVPVEFIPTALGYVRKVIKELGGEPQLRMGIRKDGPVVTDNGQFIIDARFEPVVDLREVDRVLHQTPGVIETGLFFDLATKVLVGKAEPLQVQILEKQG
ncbi:MAG TPA: ribose-5-phosphate isomerase RpiA [Bacillota bacterium]|nr:ribose-5-phosphate isomerase RpiA [Bacillota bacterium]